MPRGVSARARSGPDPRAGVFETLRVEVDGPVELGRHLARLQASVGELYRQPLPPGLAASWRSSGVRAGSRVGLRPPSRGPLEAVVELMPLPASRPPVALARVAVAGGLGSHKWCDRRLIDALARIGRPGAAADLRPRREPARSRAGQPLRRRRRRRARDAAGGRTSAPGCHAARVLALGFDVRIRELSEADLRAAREVFVTGSIGGVKAVASSDGRALAGGRAVGRRVGLGLGQRESGSARFSKIASTLRERLSE